MHIYWVSHGLLLLRGVKLNENKRVDILFQDTVWINLPVSLNGIELKEGSTVEIKEFLDEKSYEEFSQWHNLYKIISSEHEYYVLAGSITYIEEEGKYFGNSSLLPNLNLNKIVDL